MRLTNLALDKRGQVINILATGTKKRRLLDLGLTEGTEIVAKIKSPCGEPTAFLIRGTLIALRKEETDLIKIESVS